MTHNLVLLYKVSLSLALDLTWSEVIHYLVSFISTAQITGSDFEKVTLPQVEFPRKKRGSKITKNSGMFL